jgi:hypothetical protein
VTEQRSGLTMLPCLDSAEMSESRRRDLDISGNIPALLGRSAVKAASQGHYFNKAGNTVDWSLFVQAATLAKQSIAPGEPLRIQERIPFPETRVQVTNETTLGASLRLVESGLQPLALNRACKSALRFPNLHGDFQICTP